jgi:hypothetical protein
MTKIEKLEKIIAIVDKIHKHGTVYSRLPPEVLTRKRHFHPDPPRPVEPIDLTRTYGIEERRY